MSDVLKGVMQNRNAKTYKEGTVHTLDIWRELCNADQTEVAILPLDQWEKREKLLEELKNAVQKTAIVQTDDGEGDNEHYCFYCGMYGYSGSPITHSNNCNLNKLLEG